MLNIKLCHFRRHSSFLCSKTYLKKCHYWSSRMPLLVAKPGSRWTLKKNQLTKTVQKYFNTLQCVIDLYFRRNLRYWVCGNHTNPTMERPMYLNFRSQETISVRRSIHNTPLSVQSN
ncbi:hypothetical protein RF11_07657 [Thelohanellus kitauei]|uniref:Uncharacterized protein n=1 Tax=Thelohanellus kitauei TaxID=669202 RepID=A0A0C2IPD7_THEKT|nr:hypothetical protein RF11_07657 [Thelohanellus kitauei]